MAATFTDEQREALLKNHKMSVRVEFINDGTPTGPIPFIDGTVTATFTSQVTRTGQLRVPRSLVLDGTLNALTNRCVIMTGIPGIIETPVFTGRVVQYEPSSDQAVTVQLADVSRDMTKAKFEQPWRAIAGSTAAGEFVRIVGDVSGEIAVDVSRCPQVVNPYNLWEEDRAKALDDLASAMNCIWQGERYGGIVVYPNPYSTAESVVPTAIFKTGPGGNIADIQEIVSAENMANSVTLIVERTDNSTPIRVTARDTNPLSPTRWGGPFGKQNVIRKTQNPLTREAASNIAFRILNQSLALFRSWRMTTPHFPLLDPGDVIIVNWDGHVTGQVVESITYPLQAIDGTVISLRELRQEDDFDLLLGSS